MCIQKDTTKDNMKTTWLRSNNATTQRRNDEEVWLSQQSLLKKFCKAKAHRTPAKKNPQ
jgi:hypothetical protein